MQSVIQTIRFTRDLNQKELLNKSLSFQWIIHKVLSIDIVDEIARRAYPDALPAGEWVVDFYIRTR